MNLDLEEKNAKISKLFFMIDENIFDLTISDEKKTQKQKGNFKSP